MPMGGHCWMCIFGAVIGVGVIVLIVVAIVRITRRASCHKSYRSGRSYMASASGARLLGLGISMGNLFPFTASNKADRSGIAVKSCSKVAVVTLALVFAAVQVAACTLPGQIATPAERMCCKQMADRCGQAGMADSHSCCKASTTNFPAFRASAPQSRNFRPSVVHLLTVADEASAVSRALTLSFLYTASPPHLQSLTPIVLRI